MHSEPIHTQELASIHWQPEQKIHRASLAEGGKLLLWGIRHMVSAAEKDQCVDPRLEQVFYQSGTPESLVALHDTLLTIASGAKREIVVGASSLAFLTDDERLLLWPIAQLQRQPDTCACHSVKELCVHNAVHKVVAQMGILAHMLLIKQLMIINPVAPQSRLLH